MATTKEKWQEIANRGLQDRFDPQTRAKFDEAVRRGLITMPQTTQGAAQAEQTDTPKQEPTLGQRALGAVENIGSLVSGAVAEPLAGLSGIAAELIPGGKTGVEQVASTREALTFQPRTETGQSQQQAISEALQPVGEAIQVASDFLGDNVFELTGSPELATLAATAPTAVIEALGLKGLSSSTLKRASRLSTDAKKAVIQAAPTIDQLKKTSGNLYKQLDQSGVKIKPEIYDKFVSNIETKLRKEGLRRRQHPKAFDALQAIKEEAGKPIRFQDLNSLRRTAGDAAGNVLDKADARLGRIILDNIDDGIDALADIAGKDARGARALWRRAKVSESIAGMIENAGLAASGLENGLRIEARKILKSPKRSRGFTKAELNVLRDLDKGSGAANAAKFLGKFGISEGKATSMLGATIGGTIGQATGGAAGAITIPVIGQIAKKAAQRLTSGKAKFADQLVRAGGDAREIARAYMKNTPKAKQSVNSLTELLLDPSVTPDSIAKLPSRIKIIEDAKFFASEIKRKATQAVSASAIASPSLIEEENNE